MLSLGDVQDLSSNAAVMLKVSILAAWAELQSASVRQEYLVEVIKPYRWLLGPFWIGAMRDYAQLRTDPEMGVGLAAGLDLAGGLGREVLLPYYEASIPTILQAVSVSLALNDPFTTGSLDGQAFTSPTPPTSIPTATIEPVTNFYIIYGLAFESLVKAMGDSSTTTVAQTALRALASLVRPQISGSSVFQGAFFDELCTVCYRIAMSEPAAVKSEMVNLMASYVVSRHNSPAGDAGQTRRALAIVTYVLRQTIPSRDIKSTFVYSDSREDRISFLRHAFSAFGQIVACVEKVQQADLIAVGIHLFSDLLADEGPMDLAGGCLGSLKSLLDATWAAQVPGIGVTAERVVSGLLGACLTHVDDMRARVNPVASTKIKNNLLAMTLVLTSLPTSVKVSKDTVEQCGYVVGQYLGAGQERPEVSVPACQLM